MIRALIVLLMCAGTAAAQTSPGVVGEVRVHGNHTTPDAAILAIVGDVVDKFPGIDEFDITQGKVPGPVGRFWSSGMFMPILHSEDGYGFTYGMRTSFVDTLGPRSRITVPLTWGGERQARVQLERSFKAGPIERVGGEYGIIRRENPHYEIGDQRITIGARVDAAPTRWLRLGATGRRDDVEFGDLEDTVSRFGGDITLDTRVDPAFPRNAIHATFGIDRVEFDAGHANQKKADVRGYVGLFRQTVLAV